ncbi:MAG: hypothetical protein ACE5I2_11360 [Anaerolineae bacterium]
MSRQQLVIVIVSLAAVWLLAAGALAAPVADVSLVWHVMAGGGGHSASADYIMNGAAGARAPQPPGHESLSASTPLSVANASDFNYIGTTLDVADTDWPTPYEGYYLYLYDDGGDYPSLREPGWHEEAQGITHDDSNWFITQKEALWKIWVGLDLAGPGSPNVTPGLYRINLGDVPELANEGYNHFGDLSYYEYDGQGYLLVAIEIWPAEDIRPGIAVFTADTLQYVDHVRIVGQGHGPWCVVDTQTGILYTSDEDTSAIKRWSVNWGKLRTTGTLDPLQELAPLQMSNEQGQALTLGSIQGGVISPNGELLYLVGNDQNDPNAHGIQVLELSTGRRVMHSTNGYGYFNYHFDPSSWLPCEREEPEGITIWDLDNAAAPGISGQLHVIMLDNDCTENDDVTIEHYTNTILIDGSYTDPGHPDKNGTPSYPFRTVTDAYNLAWDRAQIKITAGTYPESLTLSKRIRLFAEGGTATIGTGE